MDQNLHVKVQAATDFGTGVGMWFFFAPLPFYDFASVELPCSMLVSDKNHIVIVRKKKLM